MEWSSKDRLRKVQNLFYAQPQGYFAGLIFFSLFLLLLPGVRLLMSVCVFER